MALTLPGCGKSGDKSDSSAGVDSLPIEKTFAGAEDTVKATATRAIDAVKSADYNTAMAEFLKLSADPKLTDQQRKAVAEAIDKLKSAVVEPGKEAAVEAGKAAGDAQKTLGK